MTAASVDADAVIRHLSARAAQDAITIAVLTARAEAAEGQVAALMSPPPQPQGQQE